MINFKHISRTFSRNRLKPNKWLNKWLSGFCVFFSLGFAITIGIQTSFLAVHQIQHVIRVASDQLPHSTSQIESFGCELCLALEMPLQLQGFGVVISSLVSHEILPILWKGSNFPRFSVFLPAVRAPPVITFRVII